MNINLKEYLENRLKVEYAKGEEEWADVYITPLNRIDITIVSNGAELLDSVEVSNFVLDAIKEYVKEFAEADAGKYSIGFVEFYTVEEAYDLDIHKHEIKKKPITWSDVVSLNKEFQNKESDRPYRVICFYSYKGGVGRSTALVQVAYILAKQGRNVVLIDLDIEAPSFHLIFKEWVDDPVYGVKYGLVDYLYERMVNADPKDNKIQISDIFVPIHFDETLEGNIYVFPATRKLSYEYIFKLTQLQSNIIFENRYMEEIMDSLEKSLKFDTVFIDSRTGINQWGAFSMLGFADQIMLIASPNEENIEGLSSIIDLMKRAGLDNYVVAMSKIETDNRGIRLARQYFDKLKSGGQEFIGIGYNPAIAVTQRYPFVDILEPYKILSDYIIENQVVSSNREFIKNTNIREIIAKMIKGSETINGDDTEVITNSEKKVLTDANINIITGGKENISRLSRLFKRYSSKKRREFIREENGRSVIVYKELVPIFEQEHYQDFGSFLRSHGYMADCKDKSRVWLGYLLYLINKNLEQSEQERDQERLEEKKLKGFPKLKGKGLDEYIEFMVGSDEEDIIGILKDAVSGPVTLFDSYENKLENITGSQDIVVSMFNIHQVVDSIYNKNSNKNNTSYNDDGDRGDYSILNRYEKELVKGLAECIIFCKKHVPSIRILFAHSYDFVIEHQEELSGLKGSRIDLEWKEDDVKKLVMSYINMNLFKGYADWILKNENIFGKLVNNDYHEGRVSCREEYEREIKTLMDSSVFSEKVLDLFWGIRTSTKRYSEPMITWFYDQLKSLGEVSDGMVINIINMAVDFEKKGELAESAHEGHTSRDRLISLDSFKKAFEQYHRISSPAFS
ncbi:MAG: AAA family ATPase [Firmicutes bacterium]|nr:AAA family ATPase [Bacillota bacterium]